MLNKREIYTRERKREKDTIVLNGEQLTGTKYDVRPVKILADFVDTGKLDLVGIHDGEFLLLSLFSSCLLDEGFAIAPDMDATYDGVVRRMLPYTFFGYIRADQYTSTARHAVVNTRPKDIGARYYDANERGVESYGEIRGKPRNVECNTDASV